MERSWRKTKLEVFRIAWRECTLSYRKALKTARSDYFSSLLEQNKHNPRYLFNTVAKLTKNKASTGVDISQQHSSNDFMNYFTSKIDTIRDQIVTMQPSAILSHQIVYYRSPEEQFHSFSTIGEEELYKLVKSSKPTTCMLDPITFTFMHLADAFIQSDLHCIQVTVLHLTSSCFPWESNPWSWRC